MSRRFEDNDPCDEWPRPLIYAAVGRQPCGCPIKPHLCRCVADEGVNAAQASLLTAPAGFDRGHWIEPHPGAE